MSTCPVENTTSQGMSCPRTMSSTVASPKASAAVEVDADFSNSDSEGLVCCLLRQLFHSCLTSFHAMLDTAVLNTTHTTWETQ